MSSLGSLRMPFIGATAAIYLLTFMWSLPRYTDLPLVGVTVVVGTLLSVILYALMRTLSMRNSQG